MQTASNSTTAMPSQAVNLCANCDLLIPVLFATLPGGEERHMIKLRPMTERGLCRGGGNDNPLTEQDGKTQALRTANTIVRDAWSAQQAPPFFGQIDFDPETAAAIKDVVRAEISQSLVRCRQTLESAPYATVWSILSTLAEHYGECGQRVYSHIDNAIGFSIQTGDRDYFKGGFRRACRTIGLIMPPGNDPTTIFFSHTGVADAQTDRLAAALLQGVKRLGPPPEEDASELRHWLRRASSDLSEQLTRVRAAIERDSHGHYARLFCDWLAQEEPRSRTARVFFENLTRQASALGIRLDRLVASPDIMWTEHGLSIQARPSRNNLRQLIYCNNMPTRLPQNAPLRVPVPWPEELLWEVGHTRKRIRILPLEDEIFLFAMDSQKLAARVDRWRVAAQLTCRQVLLLGMVPFTATQGGTSHGSIPQGNYHLMLIDLGSEAVQLTSKTFSAKIARDFEPSIRMTGPVIGRAGSQPLLTSRAVLEITSGAEEVEEGRTVRFTFAGRIWIKSDVAFDASGAARLSVSEIGMAGSYDPGELKVELLVKGGRTLSNARAEIVGRFFVWPGTGDLDVEAPFQIAWLPRNFLANTSEHLLPLDGGLCIDPSRGFHHAVLSVEIEERRKDFAIPVRGTRLLHYRRASNESVPVDLGTILTLDHDNRQDSLIVHSTERYADLHVRGSVIRRPFMARSEWEVTSSQILPQTPDNDQVALVFDDGRRQLLTRISHTHEPRRAEIEEDTANIKLRFELPHAVDAVGLEVHPEDGSEAFLAAVSLTATPLYEATPRWFRAEVVEHAPMRVEITVDRAAFDTRAALGLVVSRSHEGLNFTCLEDSRGRAFALPLAAELAPAPEAQKCLRALSGIMATAFQPQCDLVVRERFGPRLAAAVGQISGRGLQSPLLTSYFTRPMHGEGRFISRLDYLAPRMAPELFSVSRHSFAILRTVPRGNALTSLAMDRAAGAPVPQVDGDEAQALGNLAIWLKHAHTLPDADPISSGALREAFRLYRQRTRALDLQIALLEDVVGQALKSAIHVYSPGTETLLAHDDGAGTDRTGVRIAAYLASFARAARARRAADFHASVARRTTLPVSHVTPATSLAIHAGCELFAFFMAFWEHAEIASRIE